MSQRKKKKMQEWQVQEAETGAGAPREKIDMRGRNAAEVKKPKKHIQGMEEAELIEVKNDGECGWAAIGLGNSIASTKGSTYDAATRKNKHQLIREKKNSFGETTRLKMYGYAEGKGKEKWKKTKEKDWKAHVTGDQTKEGGPPITTFEEYTEAIQQRKKGG